jgi:threonine dehydrogenase-like Zn-dependent dehydrogenase
MVFAGNHQIDFIDVPDPTPEAGEVVLQMKASGICGSDLKMYRGPRGVGMGLRGSSASEPVIAGHEPCGVVVAIGSGVSANDAKIGDRVMVHHYWGCSSCNHCRSGWSQLCDRQVPAVYGSSAHGGHAPYLKVPARTLVPLPDELSFEAGAAISCGTGTSYAALKRMNLAGDDTIAIFGQGPVGLAATQLAAAMGARVLALDISPERLDRAKAFGADAVINPAETDPVAAILDLTGGRGADSALEAAGSPTARIQAIRCVRIWGVACMVGAGGDVTIDVGRDMMQRQLTVIGSWTFSSIGQAECARFAAQRSVRVDDIFTDRWSLDQADAAYKAVDQQVSGKGVFLM